MYSNAVMWRELIHRGGEAFQQEQYLLAKERFQAALKLAEAALSKAKITPEFSDQLTEQPAEQVVQQFLIACCNLADTHNMMGDSDVANYYYQCGWQLLQGLITAADTSPNLRKQAIEQLEKSAQEFVGLSKYSINKETLSAWKHCSSFYFQQAHSPTYH